MPPLRVLISGAPGVGKTTLIDNVGKGCKDSMKVIGFLSREVRDSKNKRVGFEMESLDGSKKAPLASVEAGVPGAKRKMRKMGQWHVDIDSFESLALPILDEALDQEGLRAFVFDEIGKMELFSDGFVERVRRILKCNDENLLVLGTVAVSGGDFIEESKTLAEVLEITKETRDAAMEEVKSRFLKAAAVATDASGPSEAAAAAASSSAPANAAPCEPPSSTPAPMPNGVSGASRSIRNGAPGESGTSGVPGVSGSVPNGAPGESGTPKEQAKAKASSRWNSKREAKKTKTGDEGEARREEKEEKEEEKEEDEEGKEMEGVEEEGGAKEMEVEEEVGSDAKASSSSAAAAAAAAADTKDLDLPRVTFDRPPKGQFSAIYLPDPPGNFASLNAGDYLLYVGGGAINKAFGIEMAKAGQTPEKRYTEIHKILISAAFSQPGKLAWIHPGMLEPRYMEDSMAMVGIMPPYPEFERLNPVGFISIAVFPEGKRPMGQEKNVAMVYAVGPNAGAVRKQPKGRQQDGKMTKSFFLETVTKLGENIAAAVQQYNAAIDEATGSGSEKASEVQAPLRKLDPEDRGRGQALTFQELEKKYKGQYSSNEIKDYWYHDCKFSKGDEMLFKPPAGVAATLPRIEVLRISLLCGGVYMHPDSNKGEVAKALVKGLVAKGGGPTMPALDFAFDEDSFAKAWKSLGYPMP